MLSVTLARVIVIVAAPIVRLIPVSAIVLHVKQHATLSIFVCHCQTPTGECDK
jgi:hypothetical protein